MNRTFAIADIHGCNRTFRKLIFDVLKITKRDTIYLLGDFIDRGADSKGVVQTIIELKRDGYDVKPLLGNHEDLLLKSYECGDEEDFLNWVMNGGDATLESYGIEWASEIPREHIDFIKNLPLYYVTDNYILVHAGLNFSLANPLSADGRFAMLWERSPDVDPKKIGGRKLIAGHSVKKINDIYESLKSNFIQLDNGCFKGKEHQGFGNLVAMKLNSSELFMQQFIG